MKKVTVEELSFTTQEDIKILEAASKADLQARFFLQGIKPNAAKVEQPNARICGSLRVRACWKRSLSLHLPRYRYFVHATAAVIEVCPTNNQGTRSTSSTRWQMVKGYRWEGPESKTVLLSKSDGNKFRPISCIQTFTRIVMVSGLCRATKDRGQKYHLSSWLTTTLNIKLYKG